MSVMKLNGKALALTLGILWSGCLLVTGLLAISLATDGDYFSKDFLLAMASVYPGYRGVPEFGDVLLGAVYGLADGAIGGWLVAWLYNRLSGPAVALGS